LAPSAGVRESRTSIWNFDLAADFARSDQASFNEKFADGGLHELVVARALGLADLGMRVMLVVVGLALLSHQQLLSSQVSKTSMYKLSRGEPP